MPLYKNAIEAIRPTLTAGVGALFTERNGGVSSGPWGGADGIQGLNVGTHVGDNAACVRMNREIVSQLVPSRPRWLTQVHDIKVLDAEDIGEDAPEADASTSLTPGVVCAVQVADCLPVLVAERHAKGVAAIHAGWKGLSLGVIEATVVRLKERLQDPNADLIAWLGPRIGYDDFECGDDVVSMYRKRYPDLPDGLRTRENGKYLLSLSAYARYALQCVGVREVIDSCLSTVAHPKRFYSFRRDGAQSGRHAGLIWIEEK